MKTIRIDLDDVVSAGSIRAALIAYCEGSDSTSCGVVGSEDSTSSEEFAVRAVEGGVPQYLDLDSGTLIEAVGVDDDEIDDDGNWPDDVIHDPWYGQSPRPMMTRCAIRPRRPTWPRP